MGEQGARYSTEVGAFAEEVVEVLAPLGNITWRKMFGGVGIFIDGSMFCLIDSAAVLHLKTDDRNRAGFVSAGSTKHSRMPYYSVPAAVLADDDRLVEWARTSAAIATS